MAGALKIRVLARLIPAALAVYELRFLASAINERELLRVITALDPRSAGAWVALLLAAALLRMLRETGRGLGASLSRPRFSLQLTVSWLACTTALIGALAVTGGAGGVLGALPAALCVGLVLAASFHGACWALRELRYVATPRVRPPQVTALALTTLVPARPPTPLLFGWSDRGPPQASAAASV